MKKIVLIVFLLLMSCITSYADETTSGSASEAAVNFNAVTNNAYGGGSSKINPLHVSKMDGSLVTASQPYKDMTPGDTTVNSLLRDYGWRIFTGDSWNTSGVKISSLKSMKIDRLWNFKGANVMITGEDVKDKPTDRVYLLNRVPKNTKKVVIAKIVMEDLEDIPETYIAQAIYDAYAEVPFKYCVVLYDPIDINLAKVRALGTATVTGNAGANNVATYGGGGGIGSAKSMSYKGGPIMVIGFSDSGQETKTDFQVIETGSPVFFDLDSYEIKTKEQLKAIYLMAEMIIQELPKLKGNQKLLIIGCTCEKGTILYNLKLGKNRAKSVGDVLAYILTKKGVSLDTVNNKIKKLSISEFYPEYKNIKDNRRVFLIKQY